jgi:type IV pilus assembly protein PilN
MKITVNLATRPYADQGPAIKNLRLGMMVLGGLLILLGVGWFHFHQRALVMQAQEDRQDAAIARIRQEQAGYQRQMQLPPNARVLEQAVFLNGLFDEKSFSWTAAMEDLERVLPAGVQVTAIEPVRAKDGRLTLRLRIAGLRERSVEMVKNMERSPRFAAPRISGENADTSQQNQNQGAMRNASLENRVNFDLLAEYNPATLEERKAELAATRKKGQAEVAAPTAVTPVSRPGYVVPNPQPAGAQGGIRPMMMMPPRPPRAQRPELQNPDPSGYDENGLKNHDQNRVPPPNADQGDPK